MRNKIVIAVVLLLAGAGAVALFTSPGSTNGITRSNLGDVEGIELDGFDDPDPVVLSSFGGKPLVVNYWASWCLFCIEEMPDFQEVYEEVADDVEFLGVNIQDNLSQAKQLLDVTGIAYPLASDPDGKVYRTLKGFSMPTTVFVDERGVIVERFSGPLTAEQLRERIGEHFGA